MSTSVNIKRGLNIRLKGEAERVFAEIPASETIAIKPKDFIGVRIRPTVKVKGVTSEKY